MKLCINCVHHWGASCDRNVTYESSEPSPVTGVIERKRLGASTSCYAERHPNGGCGVEARYYVAVSWLTRVINKIKLAQQE